MGCTDTVSTTCTQQSVQQSHSSAVVANHGTVSVGSAGVVGGYGAGALVSGYSGGAILGDAILGGVSGGAVATGYSAPVISGVVSTGSAIAEAASTEDANTGGAAIESE